MRKCAENHLDEASRGLDKSKRHAFGRTLRHPAHIDSMNLLHVAGGAKRSAADGWRVWSWWEGERHGIMRTGREGV